ncbi:MAG: hypothetical protein QMD95_03270 [Candidatus Hodarchaeaceae archaeon]|nr:hypothetical protein [Candidatus Hodarchaeaceae archaeon]
MERIRDERVLSLENRLNSLMVRLSDMERRLSALERAAGISQLGGPKASQPPEANVPHTYLRRAISKARRDYERKYL